ncbi:MAG TPA: ABC transporter substrate-binding protein, partial [Gaiellales bacterium]|nr:ABC transporter substrate-binding protein [Gaiellales bacterium]
MKPRHLVLVGTAALMVAAAAGCGGSSSSSEGTGGGGGGLPAGETMPAGGNGVPMLTRIGKTEGQLDLIAWQGYTQPNVVKPFEQQTGCQVHVTYGQTSDQMVTLIQSGNYDGVSASGDATNRLIAGKQVAPIDVGLVLDFKQISAKLQSPPHNTVNGVHYGVSYEWGGNVLMYNTKVVKPAPTSWAPVFDGKSYAGKVTAYDSPIYIADAALYLKYHQPSLGITDPYELTQPQFNAAVALLKTQHAQIGNYWSSFTSEIQDFKNGNLVIGQAWPYQVNALQAAHAPIAAVVPKEGMTGWADTWMMYAHAAHPNCMLKWMQYATTPLVQAHTAYTFGSAPANPQACVYLDKWSAGYCAQYHVTDPK